MTLHLRAEAAAGNNASNPTGDGQDGRCEAGGGGGNSGSQAGGGSDGKRSGGGGGGRKCPKFLILETVEDGKDICIIYIKKQSKLHTVYGTLHLSMRKQQSS